jgi:hypothetical protein
VVPPYAVRNEFSPQRDAEGRRRIEVVVAWPADSSRPHRTKRLSVIRKTDTSEISHLRPFASLCGEIFCSYAPPKALEGEPLYLSVTTRHRV